MLVVLLLLLQLLLLLLTVMGRRSCELFGGDELSRRRRRREDELPRLCGLAAFRTFSSSAFASLFNERHALLRRPPPSGLL